MVKDGMKPSKKGTLVYPGVGGGTNWYSPSFSPQTGLLYVSASDYADIYYTNPAEYVAGEEFLGSFGQANPDDPGYGAIRALVPQTGERAGVVADQSGWHGDRGSHYVSFGWTAAGEHRRRKCHLYIRIEGIGPWREVSS